MSNKGHITFKNVCIKYGASYQQNGMKHIYSKSYIFFGLKGTYHFCVQLL